MRSAPAAVAAPPAVAVPPAPAPAQLLGSRWAPAPVAAPVVAAEPAAVAVPAGVAVPAKVRVALRLAAPPAAVAASNKTPEAPRDVDAFQAPVQAVLPPRGGSFGGCLSALRREPPCLAWKNVRMAGPAARRPAHGRR